MFGNCSFDDAIVALVHFVAKNPTLSILSSRFSTHNRDLKIPGRGATTGTAL